MEKLRRHLFTLAALWILIVGLSLFFNYQNSINEQQRLALASAKSFFDQVVLTRKWNALHGGVYVPVSDETPPNPYLNVPMRDIEVDGLKLTLLNPSYMTRQLAELTMENGDVQIHLTSLNPIRPQNKPTPMEERALYEFEKGKNEIGLLKEEDSGTSFFYMAPLNTEKSCLQCHAVQGYKEGNIRGGISITLPFVMEIPFIPLVVTHGVLGIIGLITIFIFGKKLNNSYKIIQKQASIDSLTGIPNRRSLSEKIVQEYNRSLRSKKPLAAIMCDLDNFKQYNDSYGHVAGDLCLQKVAQKIESNLNRPGDYCARYGGEEFIIILPETSTSGAVIIAVKIRKIIEEMKIEHIKSMPSGVVTISMGVAAADGNNSLKSSKELIKNADLALYEAKKQGRNRVNSFDKLQ
ncbi:MAG: diguanylate cyclase [Spirochaetia bacterium]|nr:diguanylate cyclase [Spirochaetia bacterium]